MKITIIGCGNAGTTIGADLSLKGHDVTLLKSSDSKLHSEHFSELLSSQKVTITEGNTKKTANVTVTTDFSVIKDCDLLILYIQTNYHEMLIKKISGLLHDGQCVLIEPGYLSTCYFLKYCDKDITIVEAQSSPIDCRIVNPGCVNVLFRNVRNPVGVFPSSDIARAKDILDELDFNFEYSDSVVSAALHNPNLIVHTIGSIMSTPRIEYAAKNNLDYSMYKEVFMPHVWNLVLELDKEKMSVLEKFDCERLAYVDACKHRNSLDDELDATSVFFDYANNSAPSGPFVPDSRYITEDVPQGLVLLESLGMVVKIPTPVCTALINVASALLKRNFRDEGRTVERLGIDNINRILKKDR